MTAPNPGVRHTVRPCLRTIRPHPFQPAPGPAGVHLQEVDMMKFAEAVVQKSRFALRAALAAACAGALLAACAGSPNKSSTGELIDDSVITTKVKSALLADKTVSSMDVSDLQGPGTARRLREEPRRARTRGDHRALCHGREGGERQDRSALRRRRCGRRGTAAMRAAPGPVPCPQ